MIATKCNRHLGLIAFTPSSCDDCRVDYLGIAAKYKELREYLYVADAQFNAQNTTIGPITTFSETDPLGAKNGDNK